MNNETLTEKKEPKVETDTESPDFCLHCREEIKKNAKICKHCGLRQPKILKCIDFLMPTILTIMVFISVVQVVDTFIKHVDVKTTQNELSKLQKIYEKEVNQLEESNEIELLSNQTISEGIRKSYDELVYRMASKYSAKDGDPNYFRVKAEITNIETFYKERAPSIEYSIKRNNDISLMETSEVISLLKNDNLSDRYLASVELKRRKEKGVLDALMKVVINGSHLTVVTTAMNSINNLTAYPNLEMFMIRHHRDGNKNDHLAVLKEFWEKNKDRIEKSMLENPDKKINFHDMLYLEINKRYN